MAGLSLLSRGVGNETDRKGHKKLDVSLEPEDYYNIQSRKLYLPPIEQKVAWEEDEKYDDSPRELPLHKTFLTRKGAMLLFSEDMAIKTSHYKRSSYGRKKSLEAEDFDGFEMKTIEDLRNAVLNYGISQDQNARVIFLPKGDGDEGNAEKLYFNFLRRHKLPDFRNVRPGFSAKRYMANWSRSWDDTILNTLRTKGHIWDKNLFQQNTLLPHLYRRINDDLSEIPTPYRINRSMLMSPGSLESYEFYKIRPESGLSDHPSEGGTGSGGRESRGSMQGSIAAIARDEDDKARAVSYAELEKEQQHKVLQRLLVQSALHHQQQILEESMAKIDNKTPRASTPPSIKDIDMEKAIDVMVSVNSTNLIDVGEKAVYSDKDVKTEYTKAVKREKKFGGTAIPTLPPIPSTRQMQRNLSKEGGGDASGLPLITMEPPTPQQTFILQTERPTIAESDMSEGWASSSETDQWGANIDEEEILQKDPSLKSSKSSTMKKSSSKQSLLSSKASGPVLTGGSQLQSSTESLGDAVSVHSALKGGSLKSYRSSMKSSKKGTTESGSIVFGPDGEAISVGGAIGPDRESVASFSAVTDANRATDYATSDDSDGESYPASVATRKSRATSYQSQKEIDLKAGDIDATVSFSNWSYKMHGSQDDGGDDDADDEADEDAMSHISVPQGRASPKAESLRSMKSMISGKSGISAKTGVSTKSQMELLEDHASAVAAAVLERPVTGRNLAKDAQAAAQLWSKMLAELFKPDEEQPNRTKSAEEWHRRNSLDSLWSMESSLPGDDDGPSWPGKAKLKKPKIPRKISHKKSNSAEAAVSLLRQRLRQAGAQGKGPQQSIPAEKGTHADDLNLDITHYGTVPKDVKRGSAKSQHSRHSSAAQAKSVHSGTTEEEDEAAKAAAEEERKKAEAAKAAEEEARKKQEEEEEKRKSEAESRRSSKSKNSAEKEKKERFVVGRPKEKPQDEFLQPKAPSPAPKKEAVVPVKSGKKPKKKKEASPTKKKVEPKKKKTAKAKEKEEVKEPEPKPEPEPEPEKKPETPKEKTPSPVEEPEVEEKEPTPVATPVKEETPVPSPAKEPPTPEIEPEPSPALEEDSSAPGGPSRSQAKAAKRAAEAEKRRLAVERKRREREEAKRKAQEDAERAEQMKREFEEERLRREEELRLKRERDQLERARLEEEERERERLQRLREEREKREREEYRRKMEEMAKRMKEEEERRRLEEEKRRQEEAERRRLEEEMLAQMEEAERLEYEKRKREEEAERLKREEEERIRREEELRIRQEEAEKLARELARKQKELEARLMFNRSLQSEAHGLDHTQEINPAFVWSYFELLQYLGIEVPEALKRKDF